MKTILVIEDNKDIRENIAEILELGGYRALSAENGKRGVETALKENPDLVVCDIMMPELDGYGVLHLLRKNKATLYTPFIFLTARAERTDFRKGMELGADDYITKPFEEIELLSAIEMRLKKSEALGTSYESTPAGLQAFWKNAGTAGLISSLSDQFSTENYLKKQQVYAAGRRPRCLYLITKGKVKIFRLHEDGKEYITDISGPGDFFGYAALIEDRVYDDTAIVLEDAELLQIPADEFRKMIFGDMQVAAKFIQLITKKVKEKEDRLIDLAYSSLRKRVAAALVDIHNKYNNATEAGRVIDISRDDIAHYVGTATESLIRTLSDFRSENLLEIVEGKIRLRDPEKLKRLIY